MSFRNKYSRGIATMAALALCTGAFAACGTADVPGDSTAQNQIPTQAQPEISGYSAGSYANWEDNNPVYITLEGTSISVDGSGAIASGSVLTIHTPGVYVLSGTLNDGQILVQAAKDDTVQIVLNGAALSSSDSAPVYSALAGTTVITLADSTENYVSDGADYTYADSESSEPDAAIFSKNDLIITGNGSLSVQANYNNGIGTKDALLIESGTIHVTSANHGIRGKDSITVLDGSFTIQSGNDAIQSNSDSEGKGWILLEGGNYNLSAANDGIQAESTLSIASGTYHIISGGGSQANPIDQDGSYKGLKANGDLLIESGDFTIDSADDTVHSNANVTINSGNLNLASSDDGIHADLDLIINGGFIDISTSYEGLEGQTVTINDGAIHLYATDDGINAAGGTESGGGGRPGNPNENNQLTINGGTIVVTAEGDGIDSNGYVTMTGGTLLVNGPIRGSDAALDFDGSFQITGGVIVAAGSSGMAQAPGSDSAQNSLQVYYSSVQAGGTPVHLADSDGNALLTFTPTREYQNLVISLPELKQGETYHLYTGGSDSGTEENGLVLSGSYSGGTLLAEITLTDALTRVSDSGEAVSGGMMGMGGGGGGGRGQGAGGSQPGGGDREPPSMDSGNMPSGGDPRGGGSGGRGDGAGETSKPGNQ